MSSETISPQFRVLTVDLEDWFHQIGIPSVSDPKTWPSLESRIEANTHRLLDLFDEAGVSATFFCLGWVAKVYPNLIRQVAARGHELGCHSQLHRPIHELDESTFRSDLRTALRYLEDATGTPIRAYRAPGFSLTCACLWAIPILVSEGITCDASFFAGHHAHGGFPDLKYQAPFLLRHQGAELLEFPATTIRLGPLTMAPAGGGYFRLLPYGVIRSLISTRPYVMSYIHPRDLDPGQPMIGDVSPWRKFKANVGLRGSRAKLARLMREPGWQSIGQICKAMSLDLSAVDL
jgi:polysaccharide deacetylase family protein (PEP-CTERM system associated)